MNNTNMMVGSIYRLCRLFQIQKELGRGLTYSEWTDYTQSIRKEFDEILLEMYDRARQIAPESVDGIDRAAVVRKEAQTAFDPDNTWSTHYGPLSQALL